MDPTPPPSTCLPIGSRSSERTFGSELKAELFRVELAKTEGSLNRLNSER